MTPKQEQIGPAIGRIASGVHLITIATAEKHEGMLTTWIQQISFNPPMLIVGVQKQRSILQELTIGKQLVVNILSKQNMTAYKNFAKPWTEGLDRFAGLQCSNQSKAGPILTDCVAFLECMVKDIIECGDHCAVLCEITDGQVLNADLEPMTHLRKNGFQY